MITCHCTVAGSFSRLLESQQDYHTNEAQSATATLGSVRCLLSIFLIGRPRIRTALAVILAVSLLDWLWPPTLRNLPRNLRAY